MAKFVDLPKSVAVGTPTDNNRFLADEANQIMNEVQNIIEDTGITLSDSDLYQTSKSVARYVFGNTLVENAGTSTHGPSADNYIVERDGGDDKQIPTTLIRGMFPVKVVATNQSNNVTLQLATNTPKDWKKHDMAGNLTEIPLGYFIPDTTVFAQYDSDDDVMILKEALSKDGIENAAGKFNILDFVDFTASAPTVGGTIGDRYINTVTGTISAGTVDAAGTTVTIHKIYELYDVTGAYNWREIDEAEGDLAYDETSKGIYIFNATTWTTDILPNATTTAKGIVYLNKEITIENGGDTAHDIDFGAGVFDFDDEVGQAVTTAMTKQIDAVWAIGTGAGGLDTGSVGNDTWYHLYAIYNPSTLVSDYLFSLSATSPTMPGGYTKKRRIGSLLTGGSANILNGVYTGNRFTFDTSIKDVDITTLSTGSRDLHALSVPPLTTALMTIAVNSVTGNVGVKALYITNGASPDTLSIGLTWTQGTQENSFFTSWFEKGTDSSSQIGLRGSASDPDVRIYTQGYTDYNL